MSTVVMASSPGEQGRARWSILSLNGSLTPKCALLWIKGSPSQGAPLWKGFLSSAVKEDSPWDPMCLKVNTGLRA